MKSQPKSGDSPRSLKHLSLDDAVKTERLQEFIAQEEARGVGPANEADVLKALEKLAIPKPHRSKGRTSRSPSRGAKTGKKTR